LDLNPREIISKIQAENLAFMRAGGTLQGRLSTAHPSLSGLWTYIRRWDTTFGVVTAHIA
jgi:hypothetical protein